MEVSAEQYTLNVCKFIEQCQRHYGSPEKPASLRRLGEISGDSALPVKIGYWRRGLTEPIRSYRALVALDPKKRSVLEVVAEMEGYNFKDIGPARALSLFLSTR